MAVQPKIRITAMDYYQLPEYAEFDLIQLIDGEVVIGTAKPIKHQGIVGNVMVFCWRIAKQQGGKTYVGPVEVYFDEHNVFEPDVLYLAPDSQCNLEEKRLVGAPELVVEVLSPGTAKHDREQKFHVYEKYGVLEYWIADAANITLEVWLLQDGKFSKLGTFNADGTFDSPVLKTTVEVAALFET